ncbi:hypothetical protein GCM10010836_09830 [Aminobacter aminovorans]
MISEHVLDAALRDLFELSPVPCSISKIDHNSRYIKVKRAYLRMIGRSWSEIESQPLEVDLPYSIDDRARRERMALLASSWIEYHSVETVLTPPVPAPPPPRHAA